jgi:AbrB family transcriptional regulator, transcriptional pleiotropic regulator of transition state genes
MEVVNLKAIGIEKRVDSVGRIVIPIEIRRLLNIEFGDILEVLIDSGNIIVRKATDTKCLITGERTGNMIKLAEGKIVVSNEGAKILRAEITKEIKIAKVKKNNGKEIRNESNGAIQVIGESCRENNHE